MARDVDTFGTPEYLEGIKALGPVSPNAVKLVAKARELDFALDGSDDAAPLPEGRKLSPYDPKCTP